QSGHLLGAGDVLDVDAALAEDIRRVGLLEVVRADLVAGDVRGDGEHRGTGALSVVEADAAEEGAGSAAAGPHGERAGQCGRTAGCEGGGRLVADMDPFELRVGPQRVGEAVERISGDAVDAFDSAGHEGIDDVPGYGGHAIPSV